MFHVLPTRRFAPAAAASRLRTMEALDPGAEFCLIEKEKHAKYNGAHSISRTCSFVITPHDDSAAGGALETWYAEGHSWVCVVLWPLMVCWRGPPATHFFWRGPPATHGMLRPGHRWQFYAGVVFDLPTVPGAGSLVLVSCSGGPHTRTMHGTLPTSSTEAHDMEHGGLGSALVSKKSFMDGLSRRRARNAVAKEDDKKSAGFFDDELPLQKRQRLNSG